MRLFLAIDLPPHAKDFLARQTDELRADLPRAKWVRAEALHLTLIFIGDLEPRAIESIDRAIGAVASRAEPLEVRLGDAGSFPTRGRGTVLWCHADAGPGLASMHRRLEAALEPLELDGQKLFEPEKRAFHPHVTLARCRPAWKRRDVNRWIEAFGDVSLAFPVEEVVLFESRLTPSGPIYRAVSTYPLGEEVRGPERQDTDAFRLRPPESHLDSSGAFTASLAAP